MMIVVTGGAGFIGANLVYTLNQRGIDNIIVVDNLSNSEKVNNLSELKIRDYLDKEEFRRNLTNGKLKGIGTIFHQGACSDTMELDGRYMMDNNFTYSKEALNYCLKEEIPFIYASSASVYGPGPVFTEGAEYESALNVYAYSKLLFDQYVRNITRTNVKSQVVGLRYFNVYGDREQHKGRMASVAWHFFNQYRENGFVKLFQGSDGYENGQQCRDFISIEDVVKVNLYFYEHPDRSAIVNVGTGNSQTFNEVALAVLNAVNADRGEEGTDLAKAQKEDLLRYIPFPTALVGRYQSFTEADISQLRRAGYTESFLSVQDGVSRYMQRLLGEDTKQRKKMVGAA